MAPETPNSHSWVDLTFLGGLGEIGLNLMTLETDDYLVVVDAGLMFPEDQMLGIDIVIPDFSYLKERRDKVAAVVLTHGHEDHIGAVPFLLKEIPVPVYGTPLTLALLKEKLREHGLLADADLREISPGAPLALGPFEFEFIRVCHSIVDGVGFVVRTPQGLLVHSGDFKIDQTPVSGGAMDLNRFAHYGEAGVLALMSDSTNAERPGYTLSEREIGITLEGLIREAPGRVIVAVFASHIHRMQQIVNIAAKFGRQVLFNGKSMVVNTRLAKELGYLDVPSGLEITVGDLERLDPSRTIIVTTGSQGEPLSALARIAMEAHKQVHIQAGDLVILSSKFIPGNERAITTVINNLYRLGAEVVYQEVGGHPHLGARLPGGAEAVAQPHPAPLLHPHPRGDAPPHQAHPAGPGHGGSPTTASSWPPTAPRSGSTPGARPFRTGWTRAGSSWTAKGWGTSAASCSGTAATWPRTAW